MKHLSSLLLLLIVVSAVSCSQKQATSLKVSTGFQIGASGFPGGLMVYGESDAGKWFTIAIDGTLQKTINIDQGNWKIYAIGWDGAAKFSGNPHCGYITKNNGQTNQIEIDVSQAKCLSEDFSRLHVGKVYPYACQTFNYYDKQTDDWKPFTSLNSDIDIVSGCLDSFSAPMGYTQQLTYLKIHAVDIIGVDLGPDIFASACIKLNGETAYTLPQRNFNLVYKAFRNLEECQSNSEKHQKFVFRKGFRDQVDATKPAAYLSHTETSRDFQHHIHVKSDTPNAIRLLLPSAISRRGTSPFTSFIPSLACKNASGEYTDCINETVSAKDLIVPYDSQDEEFILRRNFSGSTCPDFSSNKSFIVNDCRVENKNLIAKVQRNRLYCYDSYGAILDMDTTNNKIIYSVTTNLNGTNVTTLKIYDKSGHKYEDYHFPVDITSGKFTIHYKPDLNVYYLHTFITSGTNTFFSRVIFDQNFNAQSTVTRVDSITYVTDIAYNVSRDTLIVGKSGALAETATWASGMLGGVYTNTTAGDIIGLLSVGNKAFFVNDNQYKVYDLASRTISTPIQVGSSTFDLFLDNNIIYALKSTLIEKFSIDDPSLVIGHSGALGAFASAGSKALLFDSLYFHANGSNLTMRLEDGTQKGFNGAAGCPEYVAIPTPQSPISLFTRSSIQYETYNKLYSLLGKKWVSNPVALANQFKTFREGSSVKSGGILESVEEHLSSRGLMSLLGDQWQTCSEIYQAVMAKPDRNIEVNKKVYDPFENKQMTINAKIYNQGSTQTLFFDVASPSSPNMIPKFFDLNFLFTITSPDNDVEKFGFKLDCSMPKNGQAFKTETDGADVETNVITNWMTATKAYAKVENLRTYTKINMGYEFNTSELTSISKLSENDLRIRTIHSLRNVAGNTVYHGALSQFDVNLTGKIILGFNQYQTQDPTQLTSAMGAYKTMFTSTNIATPSSCLSSVSPSLDQASICTTETLMDWSSRVNTTFSLPLTFRGVAGENLDYQESQTAIDQSLSH